MKMLDNLLKQMLKSCSYDAMDYGLGVCTNSLDLGCDCLGAIKYFDGVLSDGEGVLF